MCFFVQTNHTRKELLFLMFKEINLRNHSSLHKLFYSLDLRRIDKQANHNQRHRINFKDKVDPNEYIQSALKEIRKDTTIKNNKIKSNADYAPHSHVKFRKNPKEHIYLKRPFINQSQIRKIKSNQEKVFEKTNADMETKKNLREFEKLQNEVERELE